jgi:(p)ppGpp synthase/HD superfamily hydrolase
VTDKAGKPYVEHCFRVMDRVEGSDEKLVAVMHDLLEDTSLVPGDLLAAGAPPRVVAAVEALTRQEVAGTLQPLRPRERLG